MSTPVSSPEILALEAQLAEARVVALEARLAAARVSASVPAPVSTVASVSSSVASSVTGEDGDRKMHRARKPRAVDTKPEVSAEFRATEERLLQELLRRKASGPLLAWFKLFDASEYGKKHRIPVVIEDDGKFGYKMRDETYVNGLHSLEALYLIRSEYPLSGEVHYADIQRCKQTLYCFTYLYLDDSPKSSLLTRLQDIKRDLDADVVTDPSPTWGSGKACWRTKAGTYSSTPPTSPKSATSVPPIKRKERGSSVASGSVASNSAAASSVESNSVASNSVASGSVASSSMESSSLRPPPGITRRAFPPQERVILSGDGGSRFLLSRL